MPFLEKKLKQKSPFGQEVRKYYAKKFELETSVITFFNKDACKELRTLLKNDSNTRGFSSFSQVFRKLTIFLFPQTFLTTCEHCFPSN